MTGMAFWVIWFYGRPGTPNIIAASFDMQKNIFGQPGQKNAINYGAPFTC